MILAVPGWADPAMQKEAYGMLRRWETLRPAEALQLLDPTFWELCATAAKGFTPDKGLNAKR